MTEASHPFEKLTPGFIMDAVESRGFICDCRILALNSYENRVYQVGIEDGEPLIAKFYRPLRWTDEQILEEHRFSHELTDHELPVVAPLTDAEGKSLFHYGDFRFALYPRRGGRAPEFDNPGNLLIMGRTLGRLHRIGAARPFKHRPRLDCRSFGHESVSFISDRFIPSEYKANYDALTADLLQKIEEILRQVTPRYIRTHGDLHGGNILWRNEGPNIVDLDDARMAPAVQDIWMMLSGEPGARMAQLTEIMEGYEDFFDFQPRELLLVEALRSLRMLHFAAWLARRWEDPTFPIHFSWFNTVRFWGEHILELREQIAALSEPPLQMP